MDKRKRSKTNKHCVWFWKQTVEKRPLYEVATNEVVMQQKKELSNLFVFPWPQSKFFLKKSAEEVLAFMPIFSLNCYNLQ